MQELILPFLSKILPGIISRVLPSEKMSEEEAAQLSQNLQLELMKADWQSVSAEYADRASARGLASQDIAKGNAFTSFLAAAVRPLWGIGGLCVVTYSVATGYQINAPLQAILETLLKFYFGGRVIEKVTPHISAAIKK